MPFIFYDSTVLLLIPALIFAFYAQFKIRSAYKKYSKIKSSMGLTGAMVAEKILSQNGIFDVKVKPVAGKLSDHYDPKNKVVGLSEENFQSSSLASLAVAAHEVGHAIQHKNVYAPLKFRHLILPLTRITSFAAFPLFIIGMLMSYGILMDIGIWFFGAVVIFHMVTLPVEFNASSRALAVLKNNGYLAEAELNGAKKVLNAAALTYVAAAAMALVNLLRLIVIRGSE